MSLVITFNGNASNYTVPLAEFNDDAIVAAMLAVEQEHGALPRDARTGYPNFSIYQDGAEIACA